MANIALTNKGKRAATEVRTTGAAARVLRFLDHNGPSSVTDISEGLRSKPEGVKRIAVILYRQGYVEKAT